MKHTDVLVIDQFLTSTGEIYSQEDLGICKRQWVRLRKLAEMAQRAGLMPGVQCLAVGFVTSDSICYSNFRERILRSRSEKNTLGKSKLLLG